MNIKYVINTSLRGLDYYNETVFEIVSGDLAHGIVSAAVDGSMAYLKLWEDPIYQRWASPQDSKE